MMIRHMRYAATAIVCLAGLTSAMPVLAEGKPYTPPIKFDYTIIPVKGCVLRPTGNPAQAEMGCTPDVKAIAQCSETKGELGSIDGQLMCRTPRVTMPLSKGRGLTYKSSAETPYGPDAVAESTWRPKIIKVRTRP